LHERITGTPHRVLEEIEGFLNGTREFGYSIIDAGIQKGRVPDYMKLDIFKNEVHKFCIEFSIPEKTFGITG
jgi:hypothetical protein